MAKYRKHREIYKAGDYKVRSDESGFTVMSSECRLTWKGYKVHESEWDPKHPQLIIYPHDDRIIANDPRPTPETDDNLPFIE